MTKPKLFLLILSSLIYLGSLYATLTSVGLTWDEVEYFRYGSQYIKWFTDPSKMENIDRYWSINHEHPPLVKLLGGFSHLILNEKLHLASHIFSYRFFIPILGLFLFLAIFYFTFDLTKNFWSGLFASLAFFSMPRLFGQAHFLAFDFPVTVFIFLTAYATFKSLKSWRWGIAAGIFWGLALLTKFNAFLGVIPILIYLLIAILPHASLIRDDDDIKLKFSKVPMVAFLLPVACCLLLFWPWLWKDALKHFIEYLSFHVHHTYMASFYLGKTYSFPTAPWHYPWVVMLTTIPVVTLIFAFLGSLKILRKKEAILILGSILFSLLLMSLGSTPKFNGERLFLQIFPFIAVLAGLGLDELMEVINVRMGFYRPSTRSLRSLAQGSRMTGMLARSFCFFVFVFFCFRELYRSHPYYLSYYNFLVSKYNLQLETDYWGHSQIGVLDWLNKNVEQNAVLVPAFLKEAFEWYQKDGLLRQDIKIETLESKPVKVPYYIVIFQAESWFGDKKKETSWWWFVEMHEPVFVLKHSGSTLARVYYVE